MSTAAVILLILSSAAAALFTLTRIKCGEGIKSVLTKQLASVCFVALGAVTLLSSDVSGRFGSLVLLGLVFGMIGDMLLAFSGADRSGKDMYFMSGMGAFALQHIIIIISVILSLSGSGTRLLVPLLSAAVVGAALSVGLILTASKLGVLKLGDFMMPTLFYAFLLAFSVSFYVILSFSLSSFLPVALAMTAFLISDSVLAFAAFGGKDNTLTVILVHIFYFPAQMILAVCGVALI